MSNAIAQSATNLAVSGKEWTRLDFEASVKRAAFRGLSGTSKEKHNVKYSKLFSAVCADWKAHNVQLVETVDVGAGRIVTRVPASIEAEIDEAIRAYIGALMSKITTDNIISSEDFWYHHAKEMMMTARTRNVSENIIDLKEQRIAVNAHIKKAEDRLKDLAKEPTPKPDLEKSWRKRLEDLRLTKSHIISQLEKMGVPVDEARKAGTEYWNYES